MGGRAQPGGEEGTQGGRKDHRLFVAEAEPVAQPYRAQVGHGKRRVAEADGLLGAHELAERVCAAFGCPHHEHLSLAENAA